MKCMNTTRMALLVSGAALILIAAGVLYYQTDLRKNVPEGVAIAVLLALAGLFVIGFSSEFRRERRIRDVQEVEHVERGSTTVRPARPLRATSEAGHDVEHYERVETVENR